MSPRRSRSSRTSRRATRSTSTSASRWRSRWRPPGPSRARERRGRQLDVGGGLRGRELSVSAEVVSVDPSADIVTFRGPKGNLRTVHVENAAMQAKLPTLKPGQVVQFDYTEAVAASIRPSAEK